MNLPPLISRVPASVRESKMSTDEENPGAQYNEAGLEKNRVFYIKKNQPNGFFCFFWVFFGFFFFLFFLCFFGFFKIYICPEERVFRVFSVSRILLGTSRL
jgi:hypothetical protein